MSFVHRFYAYYILMYHYFQLYSIRHYSLVLHIFIICSNISNKILMNINDIVSQYSPLFAYIYFNLPIRIYLVFIHHFYSFVRDIFYHHFSFILCAMHWAYRILWIYLTFKMDKANENSSIWLVIWLVCGCFPWIYIFLLKQNFTIQLIVTLSFIGIGPIRNQRNCDVIMLKRRHNKQ